LGLHATLSDRLCHKSENHYSYFACFVRLCVLAVKLFTSTMVVSTRRKSYPSYDTSDADDEDSDDDQQNRAAAKGRKGSPKEDADYPTDSSDDLDENPKQPPKKTKATVKAGQGKKATTSKPSRASQNSEPRNPVGTNFTKEKENRREKANQKKTSAPSVSETVDLTEYEEYKERADARKERDRAKIQALKDKEEEAKLREEKMQEELDEMAQNLANNQGTLGMKSAKQEDVLKSERSVVKEATKKVYHTVKFLNTDAHVVQFGEMVMDATNISALQYSKDDTKVQKAKIKNARSTFRADHEKFWISALNDVRNYNQVSTSNVQILSY
jgi:hypothetical protein